jgi:hypothetical protein
MACERTAARDAPFTRGMEVSERLAAVLTTIDGGLMDIADAARMRKALKAVLVSNLTHGTSTALERVLDILMTMIEPEPTAVEFEQALRKGIERNLLKMAEGRRVYKASLEVPPEGVKRADWVLPIALQETVRSLEIQAEDFECAARVVMKGEDAMYSLPSWMWSQEMLDALYTKSSDEAGD